MPVFLRDLHTWRKLTGCDLTTLKMDAAGAFLPDYRVSYFANTIFIFMPREHKISHLL
jgi:hypothetical protein